MDNFTDDLDLDLIDAILDALATGTPGTEVSISDSPTYNPYSPSFQIQQQLRRESSSTFQQQLFAIHDATIWSLCQQELLACPSICLSCQSQYCRHITDQFGLMPDAKTPVVSVWNDSMLAAYAVQEYDLAVETGLYN